MELEYSKDEVRVVNHSYPMDSISFNILIFDAPPSSHKESHVLTWNSQTSSYAMHFVGKVRLYLGAFLGEANPGLKLGEVIEK